MSQRDKLPRRQLAVAFGPRTMAQALDGLPRICARKPDLVELRLDTIADSLDVRALLAARGEVPVIATLRPPNQGGECQLPNAERLRILRGAVELGAEYVDLEWNVASPDTIARLRGSGARAVIVSRHQFGAMPDLPSWWKEIAELEADVVKVVGTASGPLDCAPVFSVLGQADRPGIAIAMGDAGLPSRILALREEQCFLTYAAPDLPSSDATAPGQITLEALRHVYHAPRIDAATTFFGFLGPSAAHEQAAPCNAWLEQREINAVAVAFPMGTESSAERVLRTLGAMPGLGGWRVEGAAFQRELGAIVGRPMVNSVTVERDGRLSACWVDSLEEQLVRWQEGIPRMDAS